MGKGKSSGFSGGWISSDTKEYKSLFYDWMDDNDSQLLKGGGLASPETFYAGTDADFTETTLPSELKTESLIMNRHLVPDIGTQMRGFIGKATTGAKMLPRRVGGCAGKAPTKTASLVTIIRQAILGRFRLDTRNGAILVAKRITGLVPLGVARLRLARVIGRCSSI